MSKNKYLANDEPVRKTKSRTFKLLIALTLVLTVAVGGLVGGVVYLKGHNDDDKDTDKKAMDPNSNAITKAEFEMLVAKIENKTDFLQKTIDEVRTKAEFEMLVAKIENKTDFLQKIIDEVHTDVKVKTKCERPECVAGALQVIKSMNSSVNPCEDFYNYACGGWMATNQIPADSSRFGTFTKLRREIQDEVRGLLETMDNGDIEAVAKAKRFYRSCMDEDSIDAADTKPLLDALKDLEGWPVLDNSWNAGNYDLKTLMNNLFLYDYNFLLSYGVSSDDKHPTEHILYFDQAGVALNRDYFIKTDNKSLAVMKVYKELTIKTAVALGADQTKADREMEDMFNFEKEVAKIETPKSERRDSNKMYHLTTLGDLDKNASFHLGFKFKDLISELFQNVSITNITEATPCIVYQPDYIQRLSALLQKTPNSTINNYMVWRFVEHKIKYLSKKYRSLTDDLNEALSGVHVRPDRWKTCESYVNSGSLFGNVVGRLFIDKFFNDEDKKQAEGMIKDLRNTFNDILTESDWMDENTKHNAIEKLKAIEQKIAYDDNLLNDTYLNEKHKKWDFSENDYFGNVITELNEHARHNLKNLFKPVDRAAWTSVPAVVNAFYSPSRNRITFPAGILQPPFYGRNYPNALNYGGIGTVIGHEMSHGFDDSGKDYDKDGTLHSWWSDSALEKFNKKAQCVIDQYSNFTEKEDHLKGKLTLGENIADNGGMKISYRAYEKFVERNGEEYSLPGVTLTNRQLVFIGFAQSFCERRTPESMHNLIISNEHAPGKFRILGVMQNHKEFAKQFNCKEGSYMNPKNKCTVW